MIAFFLIQYVYRTCEQIRFCADNINASHAVLSLDTTTIKLENNLYTARIKQNGEQTPYTLEIYKIENSGIRVRINPGADLSSYRFNITHDDISVNSTKLNRRDKLNRTAGSVFDTLQDNEETKVIVSFNPLAITFSKHGEQYITINSENFMFVEDGSETPDTTYDGFIETHKHGKTAVGVDISYLSANARLTGFSEGTYPANLEDTFGSAERRYARDNYAMYGFIPLLSGHCPDFEINPTVFWMNPSDMYIQINTKSDKRIAKFISEGGYVDLVVFMEKMPQVLQQYEHITGHAQLPPAFAFGYHESKYGYPNEQKVREVLDNLEKVEFPLDVIWLDIDHLKNFAPFIVNYSWFIDLPKFISDLKSKNRYLIRITDPHLPTDPEHIPYTEALAKGFFITDNQGNQAIAPCWPGNSSWPDFFRSDVRDWWSGLYSYDKFKNEWGDNVYIWNDMNEIAVFQRIEGTNHKDWQHMHNTIESREIHNSYGLFMTAGTYKGLLQRDDNKKRPFILTRSFFAGSQKYTWHWSGDNDASWEHLRLSIDILITANLNACPYTGSDIGGFTGNTTDQLHGRWFQAAAFLYPFYRQHAAINCEYREPYLFKGTQLFDIMKNVTEQRYKLIPLWYSAAYKHTTSSSPLVAPLWYYYPEVENLHDVRFQAIVGESLMACPVVYENMTSLLIAKPPGRWYSFDNGEELNETKNISVNFDSIPVYLRGGYITPSFANSKMTVKEQMQEDLLLHIALDENLTAKGYIYFDDGESFDYVKGGFVLAEVNFTDGKLSVRPSRSTNYTKTIKSLKIYGLPESAKLQTGGDIKREGNVVTVSNLNIEINKESTSSSSKKKVGLIIGIVIAAIVVVAAICFAVYWFVFRSNSQDHEKFEESPMNV